MLTCREAKMRKIMTAASAVISMLKKPHCLQKALRLFMIPAIMLASASCDAELPQETAGASTAAAETAAAAAAMSPSAAPTASPSAVPSAQPSAPAEGSTFSVTFIDVGQGDASLIECDGQAMLIDGGMPDQSQKMYAILKRKGISNLDYIVCTHPHEDHAGGLSGALQYASCDHALAPVAESDNSAFQKFLNALSSQGVALTVPQVGDVFRLGSASFTVLGPTDIDPSMDANDISLVLRADYGSTSFLFAGDAEQQEQQLLMWNEYDSLGVTVLKAAHHGSANGASYAWVKAVHPEITVISCGEGNAYGHPHQETLDLLKQYGSQLYRTDLQGDITITSDGTAVTALPERNPDADVWQPGTLPQREISTPAAATAAAGTAAPAAAVQSYVVNTNTGKFHLPNCSSVAKIKSSNRMDYTGTRDSLIAQGYVPCKKCNP